MTECCALSAFDDGTWDFYNTVVRRAAKDHKCYECRDSIKKGTRYEYVSGLWEREFTVYKTCLICVEIRKHFSCKEGWTYGDVWEQLEESLFPTMRAGGPCLQGLSPEARGKLFERRLVWLEFNDEQQAESETAQTEEENRGQEGQETPSV